MYTDMQSAKANRQVSEWAGESERERNKLDGLNY